MSLTDALAVIEQRALRLALEARPNPRAAKQLQAPSTAGTGASPVDAPSLAETLALAVDGGLLKLAEQQSLTVSLSPFAFVSVVRPGMSQAEYRRYSALRRLDGQLTLGGAGESFDRDGDGNADPALRAQELSDSVSWEVRLRLVGSRDRRERGFETRFAARVVSVLETELDEYRNFLNAHWSAAADPATGCTTAERLEALLGRPEVRDALVRLGGHSVATLDAIAGTVADLDRRLVVSVFASRTSREAVLGPDKHAFGVRAAWGRGLLDHTLNADWTRREAPAGGAPRPESLKLGYQASGELTSAGLEGSRLSLFATWERHSNVPDARHRTVIKAGGKLEVRLAEGLSLPVSVTWANHRDLLSDADEVVGNVALTLDLADRRPKPKP